jgi:HD superfamily phosphohydrolase YqeK
LGIQKIRKIILKDFEKGFKLIVKNNYLTLLENQKEISKKQKEIYEKLI